jgi:hypothetical protein
MVRDTGVTGNYVAALVNAGRVLLPTDVNLETFT